jgi:hypothetical protein
VGDVGQGEGIGAALAQLARAAQRFEDMERGRAEAQIGQPAGKVAHRRAVAQQDQRAAARRQMRAQARKRGGMKAKAGQILYRPAQPRGGQREGGRGRMGDPFMGAGRRQGCCPRQTRTGHPIRARRPAGPAIPSRAPRLRGTGLAIRGPGT